MTSFRVQESVVPLATPSVDHGGWVLTSDSTTEWVLTPGPPGATSGWEETGS